MLKWFMTKGDISNTQFNPEEFGKRGQEYYQKIRVSLEKEVWGEYAALDFEAEKYWVGETATEALTKAKKDSPDKLFYLVQVGFPTAFRIQSFAWS